MNNITKEYHLIERMLKAKNGVSFPRAMGDLGYEVLFMAIDGELNLNEWAKIELALQGLDSNGELIGREAAFKHHGIGPEVAEKIKLENERNSSPGKTTKLLESLITRITDSLSTFEEICGQLGVQQGMDLEPAFQIISRKAEECRRVLHEQRPCREYRTIGGSDRIYNLPFEIPFRVSYQDLVRIFGLPADSGNQNTHLEWFIKSSSGAIFKIFDEEKNKISKKELMENSCQLWNLAAEENSHEKVKKFLGWLYKNIEGSNQAREI